MLGLRFCVRAFSSCGERGPLFIAVRGPLTIAASLVAEHRLQTLRLSSCGSRAQLLRGMWDLPRPGLEPMSPALAGRLSTTAPQGKPQVIYFLNWSTVDLRCCVSFWYTAKLFSYVYIYIYIYIYTHTHIFFFRFFFLIGYYKVLSIVPCAIQLTLVVYIFYV